MTPKQRIALMADLWPAAARAQGWSLTDRAHRLSVCSAALGRPLESCNQIDDHADFTTVKNRLRLLAGDLTAALHETDPTLDARATRRHKLSLQLKCLAIYTSNPDGYLRAILKDRFHRAGADPASFPTASINTLLNSLKIPHLNQLIITLDRRLASFRKKSNHTLHQMRTSAGVYCGCNQCGQNPDEPW